MANTGNEQNAAAVANAMANIYRLRPDKAQFADFADTLAILPDIGTMRMRGAQYHFKAFVQPMSAVRPTKSGYESEFPAPQQIDHADCYVTWADLAELQGTVQYTGLAAAETDSREAAVYKTAQRLVSELDADFARVANMMIHMNSDMVLAEIEEVYNEGGDGAASGGDTTICLRITETGAQAADTNGTIARFYPGQKLDVRAASDNTAVRATCIVRDVFPTREGPAGARDTNYYGPAIRVDYYAAGDDSNMNNFAANDEITLSDCTDSNFWSFPSWFSRSASVLGLTRTDTGNAWSIPWIKNWDSSGDGTGTLTTLDLDTHLREVATELAFAIKFGRKTRTKMGLKLTAAAMACIATPHLVDEFSTQVGDQMRYTIDLDPKTRKELVGVTGYDGGYWHHPLLGPVMFKPDPVATPNMFRMLEPNSWKFVLGHKGSMKSIEWLDVEGHLWHYERGANGRLINAPMAGALMRMTPICDQPRANLQGGGLKSSVQ